MITQQLKIRNGLLICLVLLAIYFASIRYCLRKRDFFTNETPIVIQFNGYLKSRLVKYDGPQGYLSVDDALQNNLLDSFVNGPKLSKADIKSHQNEDILFFNRIPKTGSEMLVLLLQWLQKDNGFRHFRLKNTVNRHLTFEEQLQLATEIGEILNISKERYITFDRHIHFTNFTKIGLKMPILINIVRDPVEKIASRFYYARVTPRPGGFTPPNYKEPPKRPFFSLEECVKLKGDECTFIDGVQYDLTIPYFCGHQKYCRELNNIAALLTAKRNAEQWYDVVGVLENLNATLALLEKKLPKFFTGVTELYFRELHGFHHNKNWQKPADTPEWVMDQIRLNLSMEYEFYYFIKQKLNAEYLKIKE